MVVWDDKETPPPPPPPFSVDADNTLLHKGQEELHLVGLFVELGFMKALPLNCLGVKGGEGLLTI